MIKAAFACTYKDDIDCARNWLGLVGVCKSYSYYTYVRHCTACVMSMPIG